MKALKRTFDQFDSDKSGAISVGTVNTILKMMGMHVSSAALEVKIISFYNHLLKIRADKISELNNCYKLIAVFDIQFRR